MIANMHLKEIFISLLLTADVSLYLDEMDVVTESAKSKIEAISHFFDQAVVVIDIDETALSNGDYLSTHSDSGHSPHWEAYYEIHPARANLPILHLTHWLQERGIQVIFLTGRPKNFVS